MMLEQLRRRAWPEAAIKVARFGQFRIVCGRFRPYRPLMIFRSAVIDAGVYLSCGRIMVNRFLVNNAGR